MSQNYNLKEMYNSMVYVPHATGIEYLCYLFHIHDLGRKNKIDTFLFSHLIMSSVLVHAGCYYKMPEAGCFINHVIYHSSED